jgi:3-hydroxy acid dehydrogenase/malonic semialdehyde reductase
MRREEPRIVFITGASAGFGAAIARNFLAIGARVIAAARRADRLEALAAQFGPERVLPLGLDVQDRAAVERAVAALPPAFSAVDLLVNNAGLALGLDRRPAQASTIGTA